MHRSFAFPRLIPASVILLLTTLTFSAQAVTTLVSPSIYSVTERVTFSLATNGASDFLFSWTDSSGTFLGVPDPTLRLTIGQTYTFQRTSTSHPFVVLNNTIASSIGGTDGSFFRKSSDFSTYSSATIFTAASGTPGIAVNWAPTIAGDYFYTCSVGFHDGMTGKIVAVAVPEPSSFSLLLLSLGALSLRRRH